MFRSLVSWFLLFFFLFSSTLDAGIFCKRRPRRSRAKRVAVTRYTTNQVYQPQAYQSNCQNGQCEVNEQPVQQSVCENGLCAEQKSVCETKESSPQVTCENGQCTIVSSDPISQVVILVNEERARHGLLPLTVDPQMQAYAMSHSRRMRSTGRMFHGRTAYRENVAMGQHSAREVVRMWMRSPGHRANILSRSTRIGVGNDGLMWTQVFH